MKRVASVLSLLLPFGAFAVSACAVGEVTDDSSIEDLSSTPPAADDEDDAESSLRMPDAPSIPEDDGGEGEEGDADDRDDAMPDTGDPSTGDPSTGDPDTGDPGAGDPGGAGTPTLACTAPNTCAGATHLGSVSGDTGAQKVSASGETSKWFTVRVTEDDSGLGGRSLFMWAMLTPPKGADFDLYVYIPSSGSGPSCGGGAYKAQPNANYPGKKVFSDEWGEDGLFSNGSDDTRTLVFEIRSVASTCSADQRWSLVVGGNEYVP